MPATRLLALYRTRKLSPVEATKAALRRIARHDRALNAYCLVDEKGALKAARESEKRWAKGKPCGLVDGVPTSIKDLILTKGWPTLRGSLTVDPKGPWRDDAPCVARLREHGAVLLGKTTTPEFGWKGVTDSALTGITRNPWDLRMTPGGSSGGAAAAVAAGMGQLAIGTDGGGSIRIPSSFSGIVGIKAQFGRVPAWPASPFGTVAHVGPMTRTVADTALMLSVIAEPDARDWFSLAPDAIDFRRGIDKGIKGLSIAYSADLGGRKVDREVAAIVAAAVKRLAALGARIEAVDPAIGDPGPVFQTLWFAGAANALGSLAKAKFAKVEKRLQEVVTMGRRIALAEYQAAMTARAAIGSTMRQFHQRHALLATPMVAVPAFEAGRLVPRDSDGRDWPAWTPFSFPFNLTGQPAITVPCGFTKAGLPVGLQLVGPPFGEALVLRAAEAYQRAYPLTERRPPIA
ncbi:MAG: amidase [Alphaproteobacteria bacterium]|nr:amidase [Alphaproteobacteria bacterium]